MNNIHILGDSFMDGEKIPHNLFTWIYSIKNYFYDYNYKNYALCGSSSYYSMNIFLKLISENKIVTNDIIIMHLSPICRDFDFNTQRKMKYSYPYSFENNSFFVTYLYLICQRIKFRLILFATDLQDNTLRFLNDEYFHLSEYELFEVADGEIKKEDYDKFKKANSIFEKQGLGISDLRTCHLSEENHYLMMQYIIDVLEKKENLHGFKEDFKEPSDIFQLTDNTGNGNNNFKFEWPKELENTENSKIRTNFIYD